MQNTICRRCEREVVTVAPEASVFEIADTMDAHSVGCVVVTDPAGRPLGIVTDRDLVRRVVATGRDAEKTQARDVMSGDVATAPLDARLPQVLEIMRARGVRRLPLVEDGRVSAIVALDDIVLELSSDLWNLSETARIELRDAQRTSRRRRLREAREEALEELRSQALHLGSEAREFLHKELGSLLESLRRRRA
jgi:CBS domain-containing protein